MSRFETSKFVRNPSLMDQEILKTTCESLGWGYEFKNSELLIFDLGSGRVAGNEYLIKVTGNEVHYNTYYLTNTKEKVDQFKESFLELNIEYVKKLILTEFKSKGFTLKSNDKFVPNQEEKISFYLIGRSKDKTELETIGQIKITILNDGTVISDSNYLPDDINKLAHSAMDSIDIHFGSKRVMTKKEIPIKYRDKITKVVPMAKIQNKKI